MSNTVIVNNDGTDVVQKTANTKFISINGRMYDITAVPSLSDQLVVEAADGVARDTAIQDVVESLEIIPEAVFVAYNGAAGSGELQSKIANIESDVARLAADSAVLVNRIGDEAMEAGQNLAHGARCMMEGREALGLRKIARCAESAQDIIDTLTVMLTRVNSLVDGAAEARALSLVVEAEKEQERIAAENAARALEAEHKEALARNEAILEELKAAEQRYEEAKAAEQEEAKKEFITNIAGVVVQGVSAIAGAVAGAFGAMSPAGKAVTAGAAVNRSIAGSNTGGAAQQGDGANNEEVEALRREQASAEAVKLKEERAVKILQEEIAVMEKELDSKQVSASSTPEDISALRTKLDAKRAELKVAVANLDTAIERHNSANNRMKGLAAGLDAISKNTDGISKSLDKVSDRAVGAREAARQEKMKFLENKLALEKEKRESMAKMAKNAEEIKNSALTINRAEVAVAALHVSVAGLAMLQKAFLTLHIFFTKIAEYCKRLLSSGVQSAVQDINSAGLTEEQRIQEYQHDDFKTRIMIDAISWAALALIRNRYISRVEQACKRSVDVLGKAPSISEALKHAPELARQLQERMDKGLADSRANSAELEKVLAAMKESDGAGA